MGRRGSQDKEFGEIIAEDGTNDRDLEIWGRHLLNKLERTKMPEMRQNYIFLYELAQRTLRNEDGVVAVTGDRGKGKSNWSMVSSMILGHLLPKDHGHPFSWGNISYRYEDIGDIVEKAGDLDRRVYNIDEAIDVARSRDAMTRANKELGRFMQKARKKRNLYFWNIPDFTELDSSIRNRVIHFWVHVFYKTDSPAAEEHRNRQYSVAALFRKDLNVFNRDKWGFDSPKRDDPAIHDVSDLSSMFKKKKGFVAFLACPRLPQIIEDRHTKASEDAIRKSGAEFKESMRVAHTGRKRRIDEEELKTESV